MVTPPEQEPADPARPSARATAAEWIDAARPRTLPLALAPVVLGTAAAHAQDGASGGPALLALGVALLLQIGVKFANDYSDGIRGTDDQRAGLPRLTASGRVEPRRVKHIAFWCFGLAAGLGAALIVVSGQWWLAVVGVLAIIAAWTYTGGKHPYGYAGLGEVSVFVFFGVVATMGTTLTQLGRFTWLSWWLAVVIGLFSCAVLMVNNIRDRETDGQHGKRTLAVRIERWTALGFAALPMHAIALAVAACPRGVRDLITALKLTSTGALVCSALIALGIVIARLAA